MQLSISGYCDSIIIARGAGVAFCSRFVCTEAFRLLWTEAMRRVCNVLLVSSPEGLIYRPAEWLEDGTSQDRYLVNAIRARDRAQIPAYGTMYWYFFFLNRW